MIIILPAPSRSSLNCLGPIAEQIIKPTELTMKIDHQQFHWENIIRRNSKETVFSTLLDTATKFFSIEL